MTAAEAHEGQAYDPRILVFSTNNISDPGIDLAGSSHMHYSPQVMVINLPCTSAVKPSWILYAMEQGFDGVFIAADGEECAYLPDCAERTSGIMQTAQDMLVEKGYEPQRVRMAAVCSVCAEPFTNYMHEYAAVPVRPGTGQEGGLMSAPTKYDALVVGSGIGGMESALKLGDMGYKVLVVEKEPSVGGKMILLSKVFPTLDCASCISTPKMGATIHHPNIDVLTYAEVEGIRGGTATAAATTPGSARSPSSSTKRPAPAVASARWPATSPCRTSTTPTWCRGGRPSSPSHRRCRRRP